MAKDAFSTLKVYLSKLTEGEHTPAEAIAAMNSWLRESGEAIKLKVEEEVEQAVAKLGFVKQAEFDMLKKEIEDLRAAAPALKESTSKKVRGEKKAVEKKVKEVKKAVKNQAKVTKKAVEKKVKVEKKVVEKRVKSVKKNAKERVEAVRKSATAKGKK